MKDNQMRVPLYKQIKEYILDQIKEEKWLHSDKIPSENKLSDQFNVSRITVKNALMELINEGYIYRIQGKGSFVSSGNSGEPIIYASETMKDKQLIAVIMRSLNSSQVINLIDAIESNLEKHGYRMILCKTLDSQKKEKEVLREMLALGVKGILICPVEGNSYNEDILRLTLNGFPIVLIDRYLRGVDTNSICADNESGAYEAVKHLIELGHSRIGFVSTNPYGTTSIEDRLIGYEKALSAHNLPIDHKLRLIHIEIKRDNKQEIEAFLSSNPDMTAIFAYNKGLGLNIIKKAAKLGIRIPDDLSLLFFDNYEASDLSRIVPTYVSQQEKELGREAVKLLISVIQNPKQPCQKISVSTKLVIRNSTAQRPSMVHKA